jgi:hypothetical protein
VRPAKTQHGCVLQNKRKSRKMKGLSCALERIESAGTKTEQEASSTPNTNKPPDQAKGKAEISSTPNTNKPPDQAKEKLRFASTNSRIHFQIYKTELNTNRNKFALKSNKFNIITVLPPSLIGTRKTKAGLTSTLRMRNKIRK